MFCQRSGFDVLTNFTLLYCFKNLSKFSAVEQEEFTVKEEESALEDESKIEVAITAEEKAESDIDIALSETDVSYTQEQIQVDLESDKSEIDFVVDINEDSEVNRSSEVKLSIRQDSEDKDIAIGFEEERLDAVEQISVEGKLSLISYL